MRRSDAGESAAEDVPEMLTISEAARRLRIGRTLAYQLAAKFLNGEPGGIPTIRLGGTLRVPSAALDDFVRMGRVVTRDDLTAAVGSAIDDYLLDTNAMAPSHTRPSRRRRVAREGIPQLPLLEAD